ncbi:MAG: signal peptidase I [Actinomycetota bacterium]
MKTLTRGAGVIMWAAAGLVALALAATFVPTFFGLETMIVASGSMGRTMPVGSVALTREADVRSIGVGDVITFRHRGTEGTTTHRVVAVKEEAGQLLFTTRGDANRSVDPEPVVASERIHRVEYVVPEVGYVVRYARSSLGVLLLIVLPVAGLALDRKRSRKKKRPSSVDLDVGWSATTFRLITAAPEALGKTATG